MLDADLGQIVHSGSLWFAGSGEMKLTTNKVFRVSIKNNYADKHLSIMLINMSATDSIFATGMINATGDLPTTSRLISNAILDGRVYPGSVDFTCDEGVVSNTDEPSGGVLVSGSLAIGPGTPSNVGGPLLLPEGCSYTIFGQASGSNSVSISFAWVEME